MRASVEAFVSVRVDEPADVVLSIAPATGWVIDEHLAITVDDRATLDAWSTHLDAHDVEHSPVRDAGYAEFLSFCDPDGIAWEIWLPTP